MTITNLHLAAVLFPPAPTMSRRGGRQPLFETPRSVVPIRGEEVAVSPPGPSMQTAESPAKSASTNYTPTTRSPSRRHARSRGR